MDAETLSQLFQAIQGHEWYAAAGLAIMVLIWVCKKAAPMVWDRIPTKWQWTPAVLAAGAMAFVDGWQEGLPWVQTLALAAFAIVSAGGVAIGGWHTVKRIGGSTPTASSVLCAQGIVLGKDGTEKVKAREISAGENASGVDSHYDPTDKHAASEPPKDGAA